MQEGKKELENPMNHTQHLDNPHPVNLVNQFAIGDPSLPKGESGQAQNRLLSLVQRAVFILNPACRLLGSSKPPAAFLSC
jgi:hypothetical protein